MSRTVRVWQCVNWESGEYACFATKADAVHAFPDATVYAEGEGTSEGVTIQPLTVTLNASGVAVAMERVWR